MLFLRESNFSEGSTFLSLSRQLTEPDTVANGINSPLFQEYNRKAGFNSQLFLRTVFTDLFVKKENKI